MEAQPLRLVGQVVGVHADAVPAHEAGAEGKEVPLRARRLQDLARVDPHSVEDLRELVHEGDVHVALGVLDHLRGLRHADRGGAVDARRDDRRVEGLHPGCGLRSRARDDLADRGEPVRSVSGIDPFGRVSDEEVPVEDETRRAFELRNADLLGRARVDGRLVHDHRPAPEDGADRAARGNERGEVRLPRIVHRRRDAHDVGVAPAQRRRVVRERESGGGELLGRHLLGRVDSPGKLRDALRLAVEADDLARPREGHRQRKPDIAETDDADSGFLH